MLLVFTFLDVKFRDSIRGYRLTRMKQCNENIEDVMDGDLYKKHFEITSLGVLRKSRRTKNCTFHCK